MYMCMFGRKNVSVYVRIVGRYGRYGRYTTCTIYII